MDILDNAITHYAGLKKKAEKIEVEEWGEDGIPAEIYVTPMTMAEGQKLNNSRKDQFEYAVELLVLKAVDADGNRLFPSALKTKLMQQVDSQVILKVAEKITEIIMPDLGDKDIAELEKN